MSRKTFEELLWVIQHQRWYPAGSREQLLAHYDAAQAVIDAARALLACDGTTTESYCDAEHTALSSAVTAYDAAILGEPEAR